MHISEKNKKTHISIIGTCVTRDIFGICDAKQELFVVDKFILNSSPISLLSPSPLKKNIDQKEVQSFFPSQFIARNCISDLRKDALEKFFAIKSEWLIIDMINIAKKIFKTEKGIATMFRTSFATPAWLKEHDYIGEYEIIKPFSLDKSYITKIINDYINVLLEHYDENKIIVVESKCCKIGIDDRNKFCRCFNQSVAKKKNNLYNFSYSIIKNKIPKAHFIPFLKWDIADLNHKWGVDMHHYTTEYYQYALEVIKLITNQITIDNLDAKIQQLNKKYSYIIKTKYDPYLYNSLFSNDSQIKMLKECEMYFMNFILKNGSKKMLNFFESHNICTCAFYGLTDLSKCLINLIKLSKIKIVYIVNDASFELNNDYKGIKLINSRVSTLENVDCLIVTDRNIDHIKNRIKNLGFKNLVIDYKTFLC